MPGVELYELFLTFQEKRKINRHFTAFTLFQVATELNPDIFDRYKLLALPEGRKETFLISQIKYQMHIIAREQDSKDVFHLN